MQMDFYLFIWKQLRHHYHKNKLDDNFIWDGKKKSIGNK